MTHITRARLDAIEKDGKLERMLAKDDDGLSWADIAWLLQIPAFGGLVVHIGRMAMAASDTGQAPSSADFAWLVLLALVAAALHFGWPLLRTSGERIRLRLRRTGTVAPAAIVQVNDRHFAADNDEWLPGSILVSSDPQAAGDPGRLVAAAQRLFALRSVDRRTLPDDQAALAWDLYHEIWMVPSLPVPAALCGGLRDCLLATVMLPPKPLRAGPLLTVLVLPGEMSPDAVRVLPEGVA